MPCKVQIPKQFPIAAPRERTYYKKIADREPLERSKRETQTQLTMEQGRINHWTMIAGVNFNHVPTVTPTYLHLQNGIKIDIAHPAKPPKNLGGRKERQIKLAALRQFMRSISHDRPAEEVIRIVRAQGLVPNSMNDAKIAWHVSMASSTAEVNSEKETMAMDYLRKMIPDTEVRKRTGITIHKLRCLKLLLQDEELGVQEYVRTTRNRTKKIVD